MQWDAGRARSVASDPVAAARESAARTGRPVIGTVSSWAPEPLLIAAGAGAMRLPAGAGRSDQGTMARAHLPASTCALSRWILEEGMQGRLDFLRAILFVQTCDTQQNLSDVWKVAVPGVPAIDLYVPVNRSSQAAPSYLVSELRRAAAEIGGITGRAVDDAALAAAVEDRAEVERALADLYAARLDARGLVPAVDFYAACMASTCLPPDEAVPLIGGLAAAIRSGEAVRAARAGATTLSCVIAGSVLPYPGLFALLDGLEVAVRDDDLSLGRRLFDRAVPGSGDPWERVARSMLERSPGAVKWDRDLGRGERFAGLAARAGVKHAIVPLFKFCDPWAWDFPSIRSCLQKKEIGTLGLELAGGEDLEGGAIRNRVEAYFEMDRVSELFDV